MSDNLLIGVRGFEHAAWDTWFYPEPLPADWRFCYYSNRLRALLVPGERLDTVTTTELESWLEDADPAFRFVLELPPSVSDPAASGADAFEVFAERAAMLLPQTSALVLRVEAPRPDLRWLAETLARCERLKPVCADLPPSWIEAGADAALARVNVSRCWRPAQTPLPVPFGDFALALVDAPDPRALRAIIETLMRWSDGARSAGLFFEEPLAAARLVEDARLLAELMGA